MGALLFVGLLLLSFNAFADDSNNSTELLISRLNEDINSRDVGVLTSDLNQIQNTEQRILLAAEQADGDVLLINEALKSANALQENVIHPSTALDFVGGTQNIDEKFVADNAQKIKDAISGIRENYVNPIQEFQGEVKKIQSLFGYQDSLFSKYNPIIGWKGDLVDEIENSIQIQNKGCPYFIIDQFSNNISSGISLDKNTNFIILCKEFINQEVNLKSIKERIISVLQKHQSLRTSYRSDIYGQVKKISDIKSTFQKNLSRIGDTSAKIITFVLPAIAAMIIGLVFVPKFYSSEVQEKIFTGNMILEVLTVFLLISAVLILGIADKIPIEALGTLLAGISGYVLGKSKSAAAN